MVVVVTKSFCLGNHLVGGEARCFVIAEAGVNHNGDLALARQLVEIAVRAGADAVKFQTFEPSRLAAASAPVATYQSRNGARHSTQLEMLKSLALSEGAHRELKGEAERRGILFLSSPFDEGSADLLEALDVPAFKIPSGEITNLPFLAHVARKGRPMLVSTGMCTLDEVREAMNVVRANGDPAVALFHCVSDYPAKDSDCNLRAMSTMRSEFQVPVGWSDHTAGTHIGMAAAALGAQVFEKHFTVDKKLPGPDHAASLEPEELGALISGMRGVEAALGSGAKVPVPAEREVARVARKSLWWRDPLPAGTLIDATHVICLRPATGLSPSRIRDVVGRRLARPVDGARMIAVDDLE
ncbi:MAG: N-acetylneuraminate synthase, partial [Polyangiaceae bacterium]